MRPVIVMPWRDRGDLTRKANFDYVLNRLLDLDAGEVLVCDDGNTTGPFNRSAAYNAGRGHRPDAEVYIWHEADMIVPRAQLEAAVASALEAPGLVVPFTTYAYLSEPASAAVLAGEHTHASIPEFTMPDGRSVGAVGVTSAATMDAVGRWDQRFTGWGYDDRAMARAFEVCCGPVRFTPGYGTHLWHSPGWEAGGKFYGGSEGLTLDERNATEANRRRYTRYKQARSPEQIRALTS